MSGMKETRELIHVIKTDGDDDAREALYGRYWERIYRSVRARMQPGLRRRVAVEDVVQETLLHAVRDFDNFDSYETEGAFMRWLNSLAINRIRDISKSLKSQKNDIAREVSLDEGTTSVSSFSGHIEDKSRRTSNIVLVNEDLLRYEQALDQLSEEEKEVIVMKDLEGCSFREIAEHRGFPSPDRARKVYLAAKEVHATRMRGN